MTTITVGQGQQYDTISAAVAASKDGDVIQVQAGTYTNDFATINTNITLEGVGGTVKMVATEDISNGKGILVTNGDVTISNFEFTGAQVSEQNGAGIRYESGNLTVNNSYFHDNENGILGASSDGTVTINNSEFDHNGTGDGYTHNLYVNDIAKLTINDSYFHDAVEGHEIKSRAEVTEISDSRIYDNDGTASYSVDLPNGGQATLTNNIIQQGANSSNPNIVAYGAEGNLHDNSSLTMTGNTIINDMAGRGAVVLNASNSEGTFEDNQVYGANQVISGSGISESGTTELASAPTLDSSHTWNSSESASSATDPNTSSDASASTGSDASATDTGASAGASTDTGSTSTDTDTSSSHASGSDTSSDASGATDTGSTTDSSADSSSSTDADGSTTDTADSTDTGTSTDDGATTHASCGGGHGGGHGGRHEYLTGLDGDDTVHFGSGRGSQAGGYGSDGVFEGGAHDRAGGVSDYAHTFSGGEHAQLGLALGHADSVSPEATATSDASTSGGYGDHHDALAAWRHSSSDFLMG